MNRCLSLLLLTALWMPVRVYAYPPPDRSFVQERIMLDESGSRYLSGKRCYYDGLGNLCQVWHMGVTPTGANLIIWPITDGAK